ncbi:hypothetical protein GF312_10315 [Candidatus Poribacteria bacterium]|nr:hypothetical protein [Candidatus Poribacteria bacterium]
MKERALFLLVVFMIFAGFSKSALALFYDFEDPGQADDWQILDGEGKIEDGRYILRKANTNSGIAVIGDMDWTDCVIKCKAWLLEGSADNIGFVWRCARNDLFYVISIRMDQRIGYCGCINGAWMNGGLPINPVPFETQVETEYELELVVEGNHFQFYVDGEDMGEWEDDQLETGMIGLRVWNAIMAVDDLSIEGPNIPKTTVEPQEKLASTWGMVKSF